MALSDEATGKVEKHVEEFGMTYPVAAGTKGMDLYKSNGIPQAFLVDHTGTIIWVGRPWDTDWPGLVDRALERAEKMADVWEIGEHPAYLDKAAVWAAKGEMGKAWKESERLLKSYVDGPLEKIEIRKFQTQFQERVDAQNAYIELFSEDGCYQEATLYVKDRIKSFKGSPAADSWTQLLKAWGKDPEIKTLIQLDKKRLQALEKAASGNAEKAKKDLRGLMKKAKGTAIADVMERAYDRVVAM